MATILTGARQLPASPVAPAAILEALAGIVTPHLSDNLARREGISGLRRYNGRGKLVGTALTVKTRPGDNLMIYKAMMQIQPGHVLVVDAGGDLSNAVLGEIMKRYLQVHGCAGVVVDGAIRDAIARIRACGKAPGILMPDIERARGYLALGAQFVAVGLDLALLRQGLADNVQAFRPGA